MELTPEKTFKIKIAEYQTTISLKKPENFRKCIIIAMEPVEI